MESGVAGSAAGLCRALAVPGWLGDAVGGVVVGAGSVMGGAWRWYGYVVAFAVGWVLSWFVLLLMMME